MMLSPHFSSSELGVDNAPTAVTVNAMRLALLLERVRALGGNEALVVTSGYRPGDPRQHGSGSAADLRVPRRDSVAFANKVLPRLSASEFGQFIIYPYTEHHVHISLPNGSKRGEVLVEVGNKQYAPWTPGTPLPAWGSRGAGSADAPPTEGAATIQGLLLLLGLVAFIFLLVGS